VLLGAAAVVLEQQVLRHGDLPGLVGRAGGGPPPGERSRAEVLDIESPTDRKIWWIAPGGRRVRQIQSQPIGFEEPS
jgi:hypothetical protein